jgi:predicted ATPase/DNA-binding SARP family transcriptional activator/class 3 adenylate cyclase
VGDARGNATATVLFSDLVGSTQLLAGLGEVAFDAFRRQHFDTLRAAIADHNGQEIKTTGDGILAVFGSAADALSSAVWMQQAIDRPASGGQSRIAIRVGLGHGDVIFEDHDVFGIPVVQAARLTAAARAGQILATAVVSAAAGGRARTTCVDLGSMTLKGLPEPVAVCEVAWDPPVRTVHLRPTLSGVEFRVLGTVEVAVGAKRIGIGSAKQRAVLAILLLHRDRMVSADTLIETLWNGRPPPSAHPTLRSLVARLRRAFDRAGVSAAEAVLRGTGPGYVLETEPERIDALRFSALLDQARSALASGEAEPAARALRAGLALWRGPALADLSEFTQIDARHLDEQRLDAVEELAEAELLLGRPTEALARLEPLVDANPFRERAWAQLMLARYRLGRQGEALAAYQRARAILADELGIDPTPSLRELHEQMLRQSPELDNTQFVPPGGAARYRRSPRPPDAVDTLVSPGTDVQRSTNGPAHNLPTALTLFVGRTRELSEVEGLLDGARLLTLTGVGGVGKTRLALQWAADAAPRYPDGVRLVEFAAIRDPALVVPTAITSIGFIPSELETDGQPPLDALCRRLSTRRLLLILDNCEHLVQPVSQLAHALLAACPNVAVLATSRETLGIPGEVVYQVPPLSLPPDVAAHFEQLADSDAVTLFHDRARCAEPGFRLTPANAGAVAEICRRLDGIPLALELAAARVRVLGAQQIADRLTDRLRLLVAGSRTTVPRHQTLRAAIDWSYQLLPSAEQVMLANLSVFPGTFDLDAVEAVSTGGPGSAGPGFETLDRLARLVDKSLVVVANDPGEVRYRLLETIRQYAGEKLDAAGDLDAAHRQHRDFFVSVAERYPIGLSAWAPRIRRAATDLDNFRAALAWSLAQGDNDALLRLVAMLWPYWEATGGAEGLDWLEHAVAAPSSAPLSTRVEIRLGLAWALRNRGADHGNRCVELINEALAMALEGGDSNAADLANVLLSDLALSTGQVDRAEHLAREALAAFQARGSSLGQGFCHYDLGWVLMCRREYTQAHEHLQTALGFGRLDEWFVTHVLATLALVSALAGHTATTQRLAEEAVETARRLPTCQVLVMALTRAAQAAVLSGHPENAKSVLTELLRVLRDLGFQRWVADALEMTAVVLVATEPARAATMLGAARSLRESLDESPGVFISDDLERCRQQAAAALGLRRYDEHEQNGSSMTSHAALDFTVRALAGENGPPRGLSTYPPDSRPQAPARARPPGEASIL